MDLRLEQKAMIFKQLSSIILLMLMPMQSSFTSAAFQPIFKISNLKLAPTLNTGTHTSTSTTTRGNANRFHKMSTETCTKPKTSLHMKLTVNIEDLPEIDLPQNIFGPILDFIPSPDLSDSISLLELDFDSSSFSSLVSSVTSVVVVPPLGEVSAGTSNNIADQFFTYSTSTGSTFDVITQSIGGVATAVFVLSGLLFAMSFPPDNFRENHEPYERGSYDPQAAREYYAKHPLLVLRRFLQLVRIANKWIIRWLYEHFIVKENDDNSASRREKRRKMQGQRAEELLEIIQKVGPTAIKVGQALSVRPDLIPKVYTEKLSELQDNVPPFDSEQAKEVLISELGSERFELLKNIDLDNPVASASIGQVYRGVVELDDERDGKKEVEVAVKVQRPNVLSEIALDLFLTRELAPLYQELTKNDTNLQRLADEWGRGFIAELTYTQEAKNTIHFNEEMKAKNLNAVCAPTVVKELSTNRVLATEWVNGIRLDKSGEEDVARLCGVALNAYLVMLLETGTLHCGEYVGFTCFHTCFDLLWIFLTLCEHRICSFQILTLE